MRHKCTYLLKLCFAIAAATLTSLVLNAQNSANKEVIHILAIGNSFSEDAIEQNLYELFKATGQEVIIGNLYIPGCSLERHYKNTKEDLREYKYRKIVGGVKTETPDVSLITALEDEKWDYVSLQQASGNSGVYETYNPYIGHLIKYVLNNVANPGLKLMFHQTWAYSKDSTHSEFPKYGNSQKSMYEAILNASRNVLNDNPQITILIPSGTAIQNGRTSPVGDKFNRDGYHLQETYGRYTAACVWYEVISGKSVVGNPYAPKQISGNLKEISQKAAHNAVLNPWKVTEMPAERTIENTAPKIAIASY